MRDNDEWGLAKKKRKPQDNIQFMTETLPRSNREMNFLSKKIDSDSLGKFCERQKAD